MLKIAEFSLAEETGKVHSPGLNFPFFAFPVPVQQLKRGTVFSGRFLAGVFSLHSATNKPQMPPKNKSLPTNLLLNPLFFFLTNRRPESPVPLPV